MAPTLTDYQYQFGDDGLLLNSDTVTPFYDMISISGMAQPEYRVTIKNREGAHGGFVESRYKNPRTVVLEFDTYIDPTEQDLSLDQLRYNFRPVDTYQPFYFKHPGINQRVLLCKVLGFEYVINQLRRINKVSCTVSLIAADPVFYDSAIYTTTFGPFSAPASGVIFDVVFDVNFGGLAGSSGFEVIYNYGNTVSYPTMRVSGLVSNPRIENQTVGLAIQFTNTDIPVGDYVTINNKAKTATYINGANYRVKMTPESSWLYLAPGPNTIFYSSASGSGLLTSTHRNAWE